MKHLYLPQNTFIYHKTPLFTTKHLYYFTTKHLYLPRNIITIIIITIIIIIIIITASSSPVGIHFILP